MSVALAPHDAAGGNVSSELTRLGLLAEEVKEAQENRRRAGDGLLAAQERLRNATAQVEAAEARFREACPVAFGIMPNRANTHPVEDWIAQRCDVSDRLAATRSTHLYRDFIEWAVATGLPQCEPARWPQTRFGRELTDRGFASRKNGGGYTLRVGIRLRGEA
ncbi:hypothetical protein [Novosphingobium sp. ST904]|uniref:hypothetical protein n=1 Tax=Novosphingobium sp. ST904 TaxID=1684385 RepID=UPI0006C89D88|nr:hypothetical protein [Novosphingobium sp. ST904]KPH60372.1 hypothetical protein ADT71_19880 [Novosphingobium sp. ST904]TCM40080.1 hypothetical protein EDF59_105320 [Novosphingobium sp. ST904]